MKYACFASALLLLLSGCRTPEAEPNPQPVSLVHDSNYRDYPILSSSLLGVPAGLILPRDPHSWNNGSVMIAHAQLMDVHHFSEATFQDRHKRVIAYRDSVARLDNPDLPYFALAQLASLTMVGQIILEDVGRRRFGEADKPIDRTWEQKDLEIFAGHVDVLVRYGTPNPGVLLPALEYLDSYWDDQRLDEAALMVAAATERWLKEQDEAEIPNPTANNVFREHTMQALRDLRAFAGAPQQAPLSLE